MLNENHTDESWYKKKENLWILGGIVTAFIAIIVPFSILYGTGWEISYNQFQNLGVVGDFFGGTTVGLFTLASIIMVTAAIVMQKEELKMQRKELELTRKEFEKARKEYEITNDTMVRQQFETTFFNMITLHHSNTDKLHNNGFDGNEVIKDALNTFSDYYYDLVSSKFKKSYIADDFEEVVDLINILQMYPVEEVRSVQTNIRSEVVDVFEKLDFRKLKKAKVEERMIKEFFRVAFRKPDENLISQAYYEFEIKHHSILSSYFNSITTIIKFLSESKFEKEDKKNVTQTNSIYREILFSQFSPHEMMMIYYFAKYTSSNEWLLEELKTYNLFYPRLGETSYKFWPVDRKNIEELSGSSGTE